MAQDDRTSGTGADDEQTGQNEESPKRGRIGKAREFVSSKVSDASGSVRDQYSKVRERVEEVDIQGATEQVRSYVRSNPGKALLISIGAGFILGLLLRRSNDDD